MNGASFGTGIAGGSWVTLTGTNLAATTKTWSTADITNGRLPTSLGGVSVSIGGSAAAVYYVSPTQVNVLAPSLAAGAVTVVLTNGSGSASAGATATAAAPGLFALSKGGKSYAIAQNVSYSTIGRSVPAAPGSVVVLYGTGFGPTSPYVDPGMNFSGSAALTNLSQLNVTIGGVAATVSWAGLVGNGLYQINAVVPAGVADGDALVSATVSGAGSAATTWLPVSSTGKQLLAKVACLGDSITAITNYPADLQTQLGSYYAVTAYGVPGSTVNLTSSLPYYNQTQYTSAKLALPDIVIILLGTNDTNSTVYSSIDRFPADYEKLIADIQAISSHPQVWIVKPTPIFTNTLGLSDANLNAGVIPGIVQVASALGLTAIDGNTALQGLPQDFIDGVHPNSTGAAILAASINAGIKQ